jgi:integrase
MTTRVNKECPPNPTLADVDAALKKCTELTPVRLRDLGSAVARVAELLGDDPARISLDLRAIGTKLAGISPAAVGLSPKSLSNIRANFMGAVKASGLAPAAPARKAPLSPAWAQLMAKLSDQRSQIGLSRLAHYADSVGLCPQQICDEVISDFLAEVRDGSLHRRPNDMHRQTTVIWNEVVVRLPDLGLAPVTIPSFRRPPQRVEWALLSDSFRLDVNAYFAWCSGEDMFAADARPRPLGPRTRRLRRDEIHAAVSALIESGVEVSTIRSLADLVTEDSFKRILRRRHDAIAGRANTFNNGLAKSLVQIAREWVKLEVGALAKLKAMTAKLPQTSSGLTPKNKSFLRQFDDPAALARLVNLPKVLWAEVKRDSKPNFRTLAKAQTALAIAILTYFPLRSQNLVDLTFGTHLFLQNDVRATSTMEVPGAETKNGNDAAWDIKPEVARMLIEYRDRFGPNIIGRRPERLFENVDGSQKSQTTVAWLVRTTLKKRAGIIMTIHQFRHLAAKVMLDDQPGNFEGAKQLLGHKNIKTTANFYGGIDSRRAARHHQHLIDQALEDQARVSRRAKREVRSTKSSKGRGGRS